jgi:hypothetical protein
MALFKWFRKDVLIRLSDEDASFISTTRYGKIRWKAEAVRTEKSTEALSAAGEAESKKPKRDL